MRLPGDVDRAGVVEHRRLERNRRERADRAHGRLRLGDEVLVAHLVVAGRAHTPPERPRVADLLAPQARELLRRRRMRPRARERPLGHLQERQRRVAAVADEVDVLRIGEEPVEQLEMPHVHRSLVPPARLAGCLGVRVEDRRDGRSGRHSRAHAAGDVCHGDAPVPDRRDSRDVVEEALGVDLLSVATREQGNEERLVGNGDARRAIEDHAEQRRPGATDAEQDQRTGHSGSVTTTSARAARPPTVT